MQIQAGFFMHFRKLWAVLACLTLILFSSTGFAQVDETETVIPPDFTISNLENQIKRVDSDRAIEADEALVIKARYEAAIEAMARAAEQREKGETLRQEFESAQEIIDGLRNRLETLQNNPASETRASDMRSGADLQRLERERILAEGELRNYENELESYRAAIQSQTELAIQDELAGAQGALATQVNRLEALDSENRGPVQTSLRTLLEAREYEMRNSVLALEQEIAFQPTRLQILELRRDVAQLNVDKTARRVVALQLKTGMRRLSLADNLYNDVSSGFTALEKSHPFILDYADENLTLAGLLRESARTASQYPRIQADIRRQLSEVDNDLEVADRLTNIGEFNRQSSVTMRQLRDQRPSIKSIQRQIDSNKKRELQATQQQLWARQELRRMPLGSLGLSENFTDWQTENSGHPLLTNTDYEILEALYAQRRSLLNQYAEYTSNEYRESKQLKLVQDRLVDNTQKLNGILDQNLLWLPSVRAIDTDWPYRAVRGGFSVFSGKNLSNTFGAFATELRRYWYGIALALGLALILYGLRPRLRGYISETAGDVGRVQKDSYWHTPGVLLTTALMAAPIPLLLFLAGVIFKNSTAPDAFIDSLGQTGIELSGFAWFFLMWREWNRDKSLFDSHYRAPRFFRRNTVRNLNWFIPSAGISIALVTLTQNSRLPDVYEGFSLLAFIVTAFILAAFGVRLLKMEKSQLTSGFSETNIIRRYYRPLILMVTLLPVSAAILAAIGYYDTARVLLSRLFFTAGITLATYALYGLLRRTLLVAQRRISLRQAQERLEKLREARKKQAEAEERGETPLPQLDYEEIDVETLSRQSGQLINTFVAIGFAITMWFVWRDLFPALSVFDNVDLWPTELQTVDGQTSAVSYVTLWNLIQSLAIAVLTFITAKNIPGLLDVFVLNRSNVDRGTRYAITNILGYVIFAIGFIWAFSKLGMDWSQLQWIAAALSVGIGFGLQEIIANFISGLIILFERPIRVGDYITIGEKSGTIRRIQIRATTLSDLDNREIFIPNKELITQKVTNWTLTDSITRIIIPVGIAYGSDTEKAREIMLDVLAANKRVLTEPRSNVFFLGFGDSSLDFELRVFVRSVDDRFAVSHDIHTEINKSLAKKGFEIPFPQRDVNLKPA